MDVVATAVRAAAEGSPLAPLFAGAAGVVSSVGPCAAGRFVAVIGLTARAGNEQRRIRVVAFVAGLCLCYVLLGSLAGALARLASYSTQLYAALSAVLVVVGMTTLVRRSHQCSEEPHRSRPQRGLLFLLGLGFGSIVSPCCGPIAIAMAGIGIAAGNTSRGALLLAAFAVGHSLPLLALLGAGRGADRMMRGAEPALATVGGTLMIALGAYYAVLA
jgi:cytochrome c-type biogenesis protein